jgi:hypothetical protein
MDEVAAQRLKREAQVEDAIVALFARALRLPLRRDRTLDRRVTVSVCDRERAVGS